ncbi:MAG: ABC transporter substrate-binding protein, partial [Bacteroidia bacterium]|nr:ABC transporter substrate-binding protein [Bacteroidia bacterium]
MVHILKAVQETTMMINSPRLAPIRRIVFLGLAATALAAALPARSQIALPAPAAPAAANPLKIGVIGPFTGPSADFGVPMLNGIQQAVDEINAVGGYLGRKVEIVRKDDQGNPDVGLKMSQELAAEKVIAVLGFCNTGVAAKSLGVFQDNKLPLIIPCATGSPLTAKYPGPESYIFRTSAKDGIQAPFVVDDILKRGWDK